MDPRCGLKAGMSGWGLETASDLRLECRFWASPFTKIGAWVLPHIACLKRISPLSFIPPALYPPLSGTFPLRGRLCFENTAIPSQPPPLRGTSFHRKEGVTARAPSFGRGCRAQRGGVGLLFCGARVLSYIVCLKRISPLSFIPSVPYPPLRGTFPSRGRLTIRGKPSIKRPLGIAPYIFAALLYFMRRTSTPHSSLLTPHSSFEQRFHP